MTLVKDLPICVTNIETTFNQDLKAVIPIDDELEPEFIPYLLLGNKSEIHSLVDLAGHGTGRLATDPFLDFEVNLPPKCERHKLTSFFKSLDDKIALNRKMNKTLEAMARALFQSWLVDFDPVKAKLAATRHGRDPELAAMAALSGKLPIRPGKPKPETLDVSAEASAKVDDQLPTAEELDTCISALDTLTKDQRQNLSQTAAHFPAAFQESDLGLIPEGWEAVPLYDTAEFVNGASFTGSDFTEKEGALPVIKIAELKQGITEQTKFTKKEVREKYRINNGDLLYSWSGSPGTSLEVFKWFGGEGWLNQHIFKINTQNETENAFVWLLLKHLKPELIRIAENKQTTGLGHVTVGDMKRLQVAYPSNTCLDTFGELVKPFYEQHSNNIQQSQTLAELRDTLLPKLLSGELPVEAATETVVAATDQ